MTTAILKLSNNGSQNLFWNYYPTTLTKAALSSAVNAQHKLAPGKGDTTRVATTKRYMFLWWVATTTPPARTMSDASIIWDATQGKLISGVTNNKFNSVFTEGANALSIQSSCPGQLSGVGPICNVCGCLHNGTCNIHGVCSCPSGWTGLTCATATGNGGNGGNGTTAKKLSTWEIVVIVFGGTFFLLFLALFIWWMVVRGKKKKRSSYGRKCKSC
jgi:hypothetical protein